MSILIKGMDKPTDCGLCPFEDFGYCNVKGERNTSESGVDADCPLIEVADRKTENSSEKPNNCEHITEDGVTCAKYPACDDCLDNPLNKIKGFKRLVKGSEQTDCETCRHYKLACELFSEVCKYEPTTQTETQNSNLTFDTPQTESTGSPIGDYRDGVGAWQTDCGWGEPNE